MNEAKLAALVESIKAVGAPVAKPIEKTAAVPAFLRRIGTGLGLTKAVGAVDNAPPSLMGKALKLMAAGTVLGTGLTGATYAASKGLHALEQSSSYKTSRKRLQEFDPDLFKGKEAVKTTDRYLHTLNRLAPTLGRDPVVSSAFVRRAKQMPDIGLALAREITGAEEGLRKLRGRPLSSEITGRLPGIPGPSFGSWS